MSTAAIADRLFTLLREGQFETAQKELHAPDVISIEPYATPMFGKETKGLEGLLEKGRVFTAMIEQVHEISLSEPLIAGDAFALTMKLDLTIRGHGRMVVNEICLYQVNNGKIVSEQFTDRFRL